MSAHIEYEITCDGFPGAGPFDCTTPRMFAKTAAAARDEAKRRGWKTARRSGKVVDLCPDHQEHPGGGA